MDTGGAHARDSDEIYLQNLGLHVPQRRQDANLD